MNIYKPNQKYFKRINLVPMGMLFFAILSCWALAGCGGGSGGHMTNQMGQ